MSKFRVYDSELLEEYPEQSWPAMAYEPIWQSLRVSCRGMWGQLATARLCCARLEVYMHHGTNRPVRIWRALNLLRAIPYNQITSVGIHAIEYSAADFIIEYTDTVRKAYQAVEPPREWDWAISRHAFIVLWRRNPGWALHLYHSLKDGRMRNRVKLELMHYLLLCAEVMSSEPMP